MYERLTGKILVDDLKPSWLIFSDGFVISRWTRFQKRAIDLVLASVGIILSAPLTLLTALAVYLDSDGPILYCQERVGENGKIFTVYKFRSMRVDAEKGGTPIWATDQDDRVTRVGRIIRKTRLDELPQFWNVLRGDMSFVGPRPERPFFVEQLAPRDPVLSAASRRQAGPHRLGAGQVPVRLVGRRRDGKAALRPLLRQAPVTGVRRVDRVRHGEGDPVREGRQVTTAAWHRLEEHRLFVFARNMATRYALIVINALIGLVVLPYNVRHLGADDYGLWMLTASVTTYFSVLELGYGGAVVKYVAEFRARRDARGLNEILSTMFFVFSAIGALVYAIAVIVAFLLPYIFNLAPGQAETGRIVLLIIAVNVALHFVFSVYGGVINGFERYYINNVVGTTFNVLAAAVNVLVLWLGLRAGRTRGRDDRRPAGSVLDLPPQCARGLPRAAHPPRAYFNRVRLRELTGFSVYLAVIDWSAKLTFMTDTFILGVFLNTTVVGIYAVAQRLADALLRMSQSTPHLPLPGHRALRRRGQHRGAAPADGEGDALPARRRRGDVRHGGGRRRRAHPGLGRPGFRGRRHGAAAAGHRGGAARVDGHPRDDPQGDGPSPLLRRRDVGVRSGKSIAQHPGCEAVRHGRRDLGDCSLRSRSWRPAASSRARAVSWGCRSARVSRGRVAGGVAGGAGRHAAEATRHQVPPTLVAMLADLACGGLLYAAIFFLFALPRDEREWLTRAINQLTGLRTPGYGLRARKSEA